MERYEELASKIEKAYQQLVDLMNEIGTLKDLANEIENAAGEIAAKYQNAFDLERLQKIKNQNQNALQKILKDTKQIDEALTGIEIMKIQTEENISSFASRIGNFEASMTKMKKAMDDIDRKLLRIIKNNEKEMGVTVQKVTSYIDASTEIEQYNKLFKIEQENNRLLKELHRRLNVSNKKSGKQNPHQKAASNN